MALPAEGPLGLRHEDEASGLTLSKRDRDPDLRPEVMRVLAVERLRKVNALVGFTRIDDMDRVGDLPQRLAPLARAPRPAWTVATEDRGEGIFLQLDEQAVASWEKQIAATGLWNAHREAHRRNFYRRFSETAENVDPDTRLKPPRYWLVHTLAHVLIRELAMTCGYSAASLSERLYAWPESDGREAAAGLLICTTASDSDGTLGGLVQLSEPARLQRVVSNALYRATRCSSDPICAMREPDDPEDFLHGAACHCCVMASETSCERANRFLDRRLLVDLPGAALASSDASIDASAARRLGQLLTGTEARDIADRLGDGDTLTVALKTVSAGRRTSIRSLLENGSDASRIAVLRAIEGARSAPTSIGALWTMPGHLARSGPLTSSVSHLVDRARHSVTCSTYNFQRSSALWTALRRAALRPELALRVYLDTAAADHHAVSWTPTTLEVAEHLRPGTVLRTSAVRRCLRP